MPRDARHAVRKSKPASIALNGFFPQRETRPAATATRSCFSSNEKFTQAKGPGIARLATGRVQRCQRCRGHEARAKAASVACSAFY